MFDRRAAPLNKDRPGSCEVKRNKGKGEKDRMNKIIGAMVLAMACCQASAKMVPSNMSMAMFRSARIKEPTVFKTKVVIADWDSIWYQERGPRENFRNQFLCVRVYPFLEKSEQSGSRHYAFVKKNSEAGKIVADTLKDGGVHAALVCLRYSDKPDFEGVCVLDEIEMLEERLSQEITVKFSGTRIGITKSKGSDYIQGKIAASIRTSLKVFKRPVLRVVVLSDENGSRVVRDSIMDEPNVKVLNDSDTLLQHTTTAGNEENEPPRWQRYIEEISKNQSEVSKETFANVTYVGLPLDIQARRGLKGWRTQHVFAYAQFGKQENAKMIGYRIEMWYRRGCVASYDTIRASDLKRLQLPEDWHVSFAHPEKFKYRSPYSKKDAVKY